jgi:hypothetical protein
MAGLSTAASGQELVVHYKLDETSGSTCFDSSSGAHHGQLAGGVVLGAPGAHTTTGSSADFDGVDDRATVPDGPKLTTLTSDLTILAWIKPRNVSKRQRVMGNDGSWTFGLDSSGLIFTTRTIQDYIVSGGLSADTWAHVAVVFDSSYDATFYVDGAPIGLVTGSAPANPPVPTWYLGCYNGAIEWFDGNLDDLQVYDTALSAQDVLFLYQNPGASLSLGQRHCSTLPNSTGAPAVITAKGSTSIAANDLVLYAQPVPDGMGVFIYGLNRTQIPFGNGRLCVGGNTQLLVPPTLGQGGVLEHALDYTIPPSTSGTITAGSTWSFQAMFRDPAAGGAFFNTSDAVELQFLP